MARYFASSDFLSLLFLSVFCSCESISLLVLFPAEAAAVSLAIERSKLLILTKRKHNYFLNFSIG